MVAAAKTLNWKDVDVFPSYLTLAYYNVITVHKVSTGT